MINTDPKTILITGSSRGIGMAIAEAFADNDFNIVLNCSRSLPELESLAKRLLRQNPNIAAIPADVSDYEQCRRLFSQIFDRFGEVDILVNNAGISYVGLFQDMKPEHWQSVISTNLNSALNCTHLAIPPMIRRKRGTILNISSVWGQAGASCEAIYAASKAAVDSFTKSLAKELGPSGIRVNAIACGVIDTDMNSRFSEIEKAALRDQIPLMRFGNVEEVAQLAYFLCSEAAGYITGQVINADGGWI